MFRTKVPFHLPDSERTCLEQLSRSARGPVGLARRARVLLLLAEGLSLRRIRAQTGMSPRRIRAWKQNWQEKGLDGLLDAPRCGRPRKLTTAREASILAATEQSPPGAVTHWSTRRWARRLGVSHVTVMRLWHKAGWQPQRLRGYRASPDPQFEAKAKDLLGLYLDPPKNAAVFCIDEKTAIQALDRRQPALPLRPGQLERRAVEHVRHGTVSLFAALEVHSGKVLGRCASRHTSAQFVEFLDQAVRVPRRKTIHVLLDNLAVHKTPRDANAGIRAALRRKRTLRRPRPNGPEAKPALSAFVQPFFERARCAYNGAVFKVKKEILGETILFPCCRR